uniref:Uncharacterized protein n=1 Tax=Rhizophora mucronata TaxID=61149 RepID=A0A2P2R097_RHIMU
MNRMQASRPVDYVKGKISRFPTKQIM